MLKGPHADLEKGFSRFAGGVYQYHKQALLALRTSDLASGACSRLLTANRGLAVAAFIDPNLSCTLAGGRRGTRGW